MSAPVKGLGAGGNGWVVAERIRDALGRPLPGPAAQTLMLPPYRRLRDPGDASYRDAAVLVLLFPGAESLDLPLILRADSIGTHRGQIGLPGGAIESGEGPEEAALREAREEIGLDPRGVELLGRLSPLPVAPSRFRIWPILGFSPRRPAMGRASPEVAELFEISLAVLLDPASIGVVSRSYEAGSYEVPAFVIGRREIWGATAMILAELRALAEELPAD